MSDEQFSAGVNAKYGLKPYGAYSLESETGFLHFLLFASRNKTSRRKRDNNELS